VALALGACAAWLVAYSTATFGASAAHFAVSNIGAAQGLVSGRGLSTNRGEPFVLWGPLLPLLLAALKLAGLRFLDGARWLTIASAFVFVALHARLLLEAARSVWTAVAASALLLVSPQFLPISASIRSQPLFLALTLAGTWTLACYLAAPRARWLVATALIGAAICLHRYDGALNVAAYALVLLVRPAGGSWLPRVRVAAFVCAVPALTLLAWLARNRAVVGSILGPRPAATAGAGAEQLLDAWRTSSWWLVPWTEDLRVRTGVGIALLCAAAAGCALRWTRREPARSRDALVAYASFPAVYGGGLALIASVLLIDMIGERILFPLLPFVLGLLLLSLEQLAARAYARGRALAAVPLALGALFVALDLGSGIPATIREVARMRAQGAGGIASPAFAGKPLAGWLREHTLEGALYSNVPEFVLLFGDRAARALEDGAQPTTEERLRGAPARAWVVWLLRSAGERARLAELESRIELERSATLPDAVVLRLR
jgi:hypothetical protein